MMSGGFRVANWGLHIGGPLKPSLDAGIWGLLIHELHYFARGRNKVGGANFAHFRIFGYGEICGG